MEEKEVLVKVEGLSKKFCKDLKKSLWYGVKDLFANVKGNKNKRELRDKEFWAVKNINFELCRGECLGLIGHNGAGKSTLLKILNGLINPDAGTVTMKGRVGSLIELGAGFNPILSGRENIYNNGAVLGFSKQEIDAKLEKIIDFAEIREFIDMPVQNYSSGMKVRLGFAVAAQMQPDILIIDEVLAVGDLGFILKCFKKIDEILPDTAVIFVSHSMPMISRICSQAMLMEKGESVFLGKDIAAAIDKYYSRFTLNDNTIVYDDGSMKLEEVSIINTSSAINNHSAQKINWGDALKVRFLFSTELDFVPRFMISIFDKEQRPVALFKANDPITPLKIKNGVICFEVNHHNLQLSKGLYAINISVVNPTRNAPILRINDIINFQVLHEEEVWPSFLLDANYTSL